MQLHIQKYEKTVSIEKKKVLLMEIIDLYLKDGSVCEINTTKQIRELVITRFNNGQIDNEIFKELKASLMENITDIYTR
jgi:hypothetical protein